MPKSQIQRYLSILSSAHSSYRQAGKKSAKSAARREALEPAMLRAMRAAGGALLNGRTERGSETAHREQSRNHDHQGAGLQGGGFQGRDFIRSKFRRGFSARPERRLPGARSPSRFSPRAKRAGFPSWREYRHVVLSPRLVGGGRVDPARAQPAGED